MHSSALLPYEQALLDASTLELQSADGRITELDVARWLAPVDAADETVLDRCLGPILDIGCGPGRFVTALMERGVPALGVDIAETAVALTRRRGIPALLRSVFADVPGKGRWPTILLMDGNIGIGGAPLTLLVRVRDLLAPTGTVIVETHPDECIDEQLVVRFRRSGVPVGPTFWWAHVGPQALGRYASEAGFGSAVYWSAGGRTFCALAA